MNPKLHSTVFLDFNLDRVKWKDFLKNYNFQ